MKQKRVLDPTGTTLIRKAYVREMVKRMKALSRQVGEAVIQNDMLGLNGNQKTLKVNADNGKNRYRFQTDPEKVRAFTEWFKDQASRGLLGIPNRDAVKETRTDGWWMNSYVDSAYKKGVKDAYKNGVSSGWVNTIFGKMTSDQMAEAFFYQPIKAKSLKNLYTRSFTFLKNMTKDMAEATAKSLTRSLADGLGAQETGRRLQAAVGIMTRTRAMTIARTEVIHTHAESSLDAYEDMGVEGVKVAAEWEATNDDRCCPDCSKKQGQIFTIAEARGMIPYHPNCRCAFLPIPIDDLSASQRKALTGGKGKGGKPKPKPKPKPEPETTPEPTTTLGDVPEKVKTPEPSLTEKVVKELHTDTRYKTAEEYRLKIIQAGELTPEEHAKYQEPLDKAIAEEKRLAALRKEMSIKVMNLMPGQTDVESAQTRVDFYKAVSDHNAATKLIPMLEKTKRDFVRSKVWEHLTEPENMSGWSSSKWKGYESTAKDILSIIPKKKFTQEEGQKFQAVTVKSRHRKRISCLGQYSASEKLLEIFCENMPQFDHMLTFVHEFGHHLSYQAYDMMDKTSEFFQQRTKGEMSVKTLPGFERGTSGKVDNFATYNVYAGRIYPRYGKDHTPEIMSVGIETIYRDPVHAAKADPEWFNMMIRTMKRLEA